MATTEPPTEPTTSQPADTESTANQTPYLVTYRNGSGFRTLRAKDYGFGDNGHLKIVDADNRKHVFSAAGEWKISEVPDE